MGILAILGPILPYILMAVGVIGAYFGIKAKGKSEAKAQFQKQQAEVQQKVQAEVQVAVGKDEVVDAKTAQKVEEIKHESQIVAPSDSTKFKF